MLDLSYTISNSGRSSMSTKSSSLVKPLVEKAFSPRNALFFPPFVRGESGRLACGVTVSFPESEGDDSSVREIPRTGTGILKALRRVLMEN